jgi:hypothetical protein
MGASHEAGCDKLPGTSFSATTPGWLSSCAGRTLTGISLPQPQSVHASFGVSYAGS